jgi:hypothetical protein
MPPPFQVSYPEAVRNHLKRLHAKAAQKALEQSVLDAVRRIDHRLRSDANVFGEPKYHYRALKLQLRVAIEPPLVVHFMVHDEQPLVFVKSLRALPGQGF